MGNKNLGYFFAYRKKNISFLDYHMFVPNEEKEGENHRKRTIGKDTSIEPFKPFTQILGKLISSGEGKKEDKIDI